MTAQRRRAVAAALWAAALAVVWIANSATHRPVLVVSRSDLPIAMPHSVVVTDRIVANGPDPFMVLTAPKRPVRTVRLTIVPGKGERRDFWLYYIPRGSSGATPFNDHDTALAHVTVSPDVWRVDWELPVDIRGWRIDVPDDADFRVVSLEAWDTPGATATDLDDVVRSAVVLLLAALLVAGGAAIAGRARPPAGWRTDAAWIALLAVPLTIFVFVLPPFEGPDENWHWMLAVAASRPALASESTAFQLPMIVRPVPFKVTPGRMTMGPVPPMPPSEIESRLRFLHANYPYARPWAYPLTTIVMWLYPRVDTVRQAVLLFYVCRLLPALVLCGVLLYAVRRYRLLLTGLVFFSLPLVVEQHVIVSADILLNLGALGVALLFLRHRERAGVWTSAAIWVLTLTILSIKFVYAPLLLLPLMTVPRGRTRRAILAAGALAALAASVPMLLMVKQQVRAYADTVHRLPLADQQIAALGHVWGWKEFLAQYGRYVWSLFDVGAWSGPLGWLYVPLSHAHVTLIAASVAIAVAYDAWQIAADWPAWKGVLPPAVALGVGGLFFTTFVDVLLYHLMTTSLGAQDVAGVQVRHFFPIVIAALCVAAPVRRMDDTPGTRVWVRTFALAALGGLLLIRSAQLAQDLLVCFW